eukprot:1186934-Prorocentrum_minimum.AAC.3
MQGELSIIYKSSAPLQPRNAILRVGTGLVVALVQRQGEHDYAIAATHRSPAPPRQTELLDGKRRGKETAKDVRNDEADLGKAALMAARVEHQQLKEENANLK